MPEYDYCEVRKENAFKVNVTMKPTEFYMSSRYESEFIEQLNDLMNKYVNK